MKHPFEQLLAVAREVSFMKGAELVRQGEASRGCYLIRAGVKRSPQASFDWKAFLPVLPFFEGFDAGEIDEVASTGKALELPRGAWIFAAGLKADACYIVLRGAVEIFTRNGAKDRRVAIAGPGELVGFVALLRGAVHGGNARAREACCLLEIPRAAFLDIYNGTSGTTVRLHHAIHRSLMRSIARTNTQLTRLISHARLTAAASQATELEAALHGQIWRAEVSE